MLEEPKIKKVDKRDKQLPQNFEQLIEMYDVEKIWPYMKKVIDYINNDLEKVTVSPTEPVNKEEVWLQKNKNLFNALTMFASSWSTVTTIENTNNGIMFKGGASTWQYVSFLLDLKAGTYAFQRKWKLVSGIQDNHTGEVAITKKSDSSNLLFLSSSMSDGVFTITEDTTIRIVIYLNRDVALTEETQIEVYDIQLEKGSVATECGPHTENKILTKDKDGKYEEFMKESVVISPTEPTINRRDIWIQRGNNIFKDNLMYGLGNCTYSDGVVAQTTADTNQNPNWKLQAFTKSWDYIRLLKEFQVSLGRNTQTFVKTSDFNILQFGVNGSVIDTVLFIDVSNLEDNRTYAISFEVTNLTQGSISWKDIQIEEGTKATNYMPNIDKKIYCKNDNGVYEEFVNAETIGGEIITNANGTAIKHPNGILEVFGRLTIQATFSVWSSTNGIYSYDHVTPYLFPVPFIETPTIVSTVTGHSAAFIIRTFKTTTAITQISIGRPNIFDGEYVIDYIAKGKWK